jgi:dolichyl-phosphate-mannose--protein O-mannosyl transferase
VRLKILSVLIVILLYSLLAGMAAYTDDFVNDETEELLSGYMIATDQYYRFNPYHPPLFKSLYGAALYFFNPNKNDNYHKFVKGNLISNLPSQNQASAQFAIDFGGDGYLPARAISLIATVVFMLVAAWILVKHFGYSVSLLWILLVALNPTWLAHSHYALLDVPASFFIFGCVYFLALWLSSLKVKALVIFTVLLTFGLLTKFSSLILIPCSILSAIFIAEGGFKRGNILRQYSSEKNHGSDKCVFGYYTDEKAQT